MSEGGKSPEQPIRATLRDRLTKFIPSRFRRSVKQESQITEAAGLHSKIAPLTDASEGGSKKTAEVSLDAISTPNADPAEIIPTAPPNELDAVTVDSLDEPPVGEVAEEILALPPRRTGIAKTFSEMLKRRNPKAPEIISGGGVPAIIGTNETVGAGFFEAVQDKNPDGYVIGVGAGNVFTMVHCFREGVIPKGIISSDIEPKAVAMGKMVINGLKQTESVEEFQNKFLGMPEEAFDKSIEFLIASEQNDALKEQWKKISQDDWRKVWAELGKEEYFTWDKIRAYKYEGQNIDVRGAILDKFTVLKQLATEDNIVIEYADFTDNAFVHSVVNLPEFGDSTNIVYFSNIVDHITHRGTNLGNLNLIKKLSVYQFQDKWPIFIDTLGNKLNYYLRARNSLADFTEADFEYMGIQPRAKKPDGLLFPDSTH